MKKKKKHQNETMTHELNTLTPKHLLFDFELFFSLSMNHEQVSI